MRRAFTISFCECVFSLFIIILIFRCIWLSVTGFLLLLLSLAVYKSFECIALFCSLHSNICNSRFRNDDARRRQFRLYANCYWIYESAHTSTKSRVCTLYVWDTNDKYINCVMDSYESVTFWILLESVARFFAQCIQFVEFMSYVIIYDEAKMNGFDVSSQ